MLQLKPPRWIKGMRAHGWSRLSVGFLPFVVGGCLLLTIGLWSQSTDRLHAQSREATKKLADQETVDVNSQLHTYFDTLYSFRALFQATDYVSRADFHNYYESSMISKRLNGFNAITFIRYVPADQVPQIINQIRADTSFGAGTAANFSVQAPNGASVIYPITYVEPWTPAASYGYDLGQSSERLKTLATAASTGAPTATNSMALIGNGSAANQGFLITIAVHDLRNPASTSPYGFINIIFRYNKLFSALFSKVDANVSVHDGTHKLVYQHKGAKGALGQQQVKDINVAGKTWQIAYVTPNDYGIGNDSTRQPMLVLYFGLLATMLLGIIFVVLLRSRQNAYRLAQSITADLRTAEHEHDLMINSIKDYAIFTLDPQGNIASWNKGAAQIKGYEEQEVLGKSFTIFYIDKEKAAARRLLGKAQRHGSVRIEILQKRKNGTTFWSEVCITAVRNELGELIGYAKITRDLTERQKLETERDSFIAIATHELRTPITSIKAFGQVLQNRFKRSGDLESAKLLGRMDSQLDRLTKLVRDLLDASKIENNKLEYTVSEFDLDTFMESIVGQLAVGLTNHYIILRGKVQQTISSDRSRLEQVLTNLIENAAKYSPPGSNIVVAYRKVKTTIEFTVTDQGVGIAKADLSKVFRRFYRTKQTAGVLGFGLGLYLSAEIVKNLGGHIWATSRVKHGSTFHIVLPLKSVQP